VFKRLNSFPEKCSDFGAAFEWSIERPSRCFLDLSFDEAAVLRGVFVVRSGELGAIDYHRGPDDDFPAFYLDLHRITIGPYVELRLPYISVRSIAGGSLCMFGKAHKKKPRLDHPRRGWSQRRRQRTKAENSFTNIARGSPTGVNRPKRFRFLAAPSRPSASFQISYFQRGRATQIRSDIQCFK
jgi:hypothetical protein